MRAVVAQLTAKLQGLATREQVVALQHQVMLSRYAADHALSATSEACVKNGAIFYVVDEARRQPLFCGFFVGRRIALTIHHDEMFQQPLPFPLSAVASNGRLLQLQCIATDAKLDYSVLQLVGAESEAYFDLPAHSSVTPGLSLGLVSMGVWSQFAL